MINPYLQQFFRRDLHRGDVYSCMRNYENAYTPWTDVRFTLQNQVVSKESTGCFDSKHKERLGDSGTIDIAILFLNFVLTGVQQSFPDSPHMKYVEVHLPYYFANCRWVFHTRSIWHCLKVCWDPIQMFYSNLLVADLNATFSNAITWMAWLLSL